jgi:hypothetical protein
MPYELPPFRKYAKAAADADVYRKAATEIGGEFGRGLGAGALANLARKRADEQAKAERERLARVKMAELMGEYEAGAGDLPSEQKLYSGVAALAKAKIDRERAEAERADYQRQVGDVADTYRGLFESGKMKPRDKALEKAIYEQPQPMTDPQTGARFTPEGVPQSIRAGFEQGRREYEAQIEKSKLAKEAADTARIGALARFATASAAVTRPERLPPERIPRKDVVDSLEAATKLRETADALRSQLRKVETGPLAGRLAKWSPSVFGGSTLYDFLMGEGATADAAEFRATIAAMRLLAGNAEVRGALSNTDQQLVDQKIGTIETDYKALLRMADVLGKGAEKVEHRRYGFWERYYPKEDLEILRQSFESDLPTLPDATPPQADAGKVWFNPKTHDVQMKPTAGYQEMTEDELEAMLLGK